MPDRTPLVRLLLFGTVAGFFAALFGVGGGIIMVPLLMAFGGFRSKAAAATSLAAILFTGVYGALRYHVDGEVAWTDAALIGFPAVAGVLLGTRLQKRVTNDGLTLLFAVVLGAVGVRLLVG